MLSAVLTRAIRVLSRLLVAGIVSSTIVVAQATQAGEDSIKAAFLYNFAKYVDWPANAFPTGTVRICAFADADFVKQLDQIIEGETVNGRPVTRPPAPSAQDAWRACDILFVSNSEAAHAEALLASVHSAHVLTVGEGTTFIKRGGMFAFIKENDRIRFDVNAAEAERVGLTISSRLLRLARHVIARDGDRQP